jgi:DNA-binding FadR family transcriptional regulator
MTDAQGLPASPVADGRAAPGAGGPRKSKIAERTAQQIGERIRRDRLREGDALPNERDMMAELGVGRTTLREALRLLETQGVLRIKPGPGGGPVIRRPEPADLVGPMSLLLQSLGSTMDEALVAWEALEPVAARLAARVAGQQDVERLSAQLERMRRSTSEPAFYAENRAFHHLVAQLAGNTVLLVVLQSIEQVTADIAQGIKVPRRVRSSLVRGSAAVTAAIRERNGAAAADSMTQLVGHWRRFIATTYPAALSAPVRWTLPNS